MDTETALCQGVEWGGRPDAAGPAPADPVDAADLDADCVVDERPPARHGTWPEWGRLITERCPSTHPAGGGQCALTSHRGRVHRDRSGVVWTDPADSPSAGGTAP